MGPLDILSRLHGIDKTAAGILYGGIAVLAAVAVIDNFGLGDTIWYLATPFLAIAIGFAIIKFIITDKIIMHVLSWFFTLLLIVYISVVVVSVVFKDQRIPPAYCLVRPLAPCTEVSERLAEKIEQKSGALVPPAVAKPTTPPGAAIAAVATPVAPAPSSTVAKPQQPTNTTVAAIASPAVNPDDYAVYVQFAGLMTRDSVRAMMKRLATIGWRVQGTGEGGERTAKAAGENEIRFHGDESRAAAEALARTINEFNLTAWPVTAEEEPNPRIPAQTLEVWISK